jgi:predicted fused transcriptional regulator/phosphomethylpyrimidine kinase
MVAFVVAAGRGGADEDRFVVPDADGAQTRGCAGLRGGVVGVWGRARSARKVKPGAQRWVENSIQSR